MMEFAVGASVEAVDQLGIWSKAKVTSSWLYIHLDSSKRYDFNKARRQKS